MKLYKAFLVRTPTFLSDSYVSAAVDPESKTAGLSIHDGEHSICLRYSFAENKAELQQTLSGLKAAIAFIEREASLAAAVPTAAKGLVKNLLATAIKKLH
jgi:hypothetical protein